MKPVILFWKIQLKLFMAWFSEFLQQKMWKIQALKKTNFKAIIDERRNEHFFRIFISKEIPIFEYLRKRNSFSKVDDKAGIFSYQSSFFFGVFSKVVEE